MGINIPRIYASLEDRQTKHQSHMIEVEGNIINHPTFILIDLGASHNYIDPKVVDSVIENFSSPHATCLDGLSISLCRLEVPFLYLQEKKKSYFSTYTHPTN
jgi:hypothetical protein